MEPAVSLRDRCAQVVLFSLAISWPLSLAVGSGSTLRPGFRQPLSTPNTWLEIELLGGELFQTGPKLEVSQPKSVTLLWRTQLGGRFAARWEVSDNVAPNTRIAAVTPHVVASGSIVSQTGKGSFEINFSSFLPPTPPSSPHTYYIWLTSEEGLRGSPKVNCNMVRVIYRQPPPQADLSD